MRDNEQDKQLRALTDMVAVLRNKNEEANMRYHHDRCPGLANWSGKGAFNLNYLGISLFQAS